jgi:CRISPR-associated endonuclease/helicase Cas3
MAGKTTPSGGSTRFLETSRGVLSYAQLAPLLAEKVLGLEQSIASGEFDGKALDSELILLFHAAIAGELVPEWAGRWRTIEVRVGQHQPPLPHQVRTLMQLYSDDLRARLEHASSRFDDLLLETLAFAEGRLLSIHPFNDFNGRVTRLFLRELLRRLNLPPVDLVPTTQDGEKLYLDALHSGDHNDLLPLTRIWEHRFQEFQ